MSSSLFSGHVGLSPCQRVKSSVDARRCSISGDCSGGRAHMASWAHVTQHRLARADAAVRAIPPLSRVRARRKEPAVGLSSMEFLPIFLSHRLTNLEMAIGSQLTYTVKANCGYIRLVVCPCVAMVYLNIFLPQI
jgi:hypothetical protein